MAAAHWSTPVNEGDYAFAHERDDENDVETAEKERDAALCAQSMAALLFDYYRVYRDRDGYEHLLVAKQVRCAEAYARARELRDIYLGEVS